MRRGLVDTLPDYMLTSAYVVLDAFPRTETGKIDRRALPPPDPVVDAPFVGPRTPLEELLATIWADVLGLDRVGVHDDFLELGGDSLRATRMRARAPS